MEVKLEFYLVNNQRVLYINGNPAHLYSNEELEALGFPVKPWPKSDDSATG